MGSKVESIQSVEALPVLQKAPTIDELVLKEFPELPPVSSRHEIQPRMEIVRAFAQATQTEPFDLLESPEPAESPAVDFAPTRKSSVLETLAKLRTLPRLKTLQKSLPPIEEDLLPLPLPREYSNEDEKRPDSPMADITSPILLTKESIASITSPKATTDQTTTPVMTTPATTPVITRKSAKSIDKQPIAEMIELVLYINQNEHRLQRTKIEKEIVKIFQKSDRIETLRVLGEKRDDPIMAKLLGHVSALSLACETNRSVLVLEDTFKFYIGRDELQQHLRLVQRSFGDRWNVVVFGHTASEWSPVEHGSDDGVQLMRILEGTFTSGYLVNRTYIPALLNLMIEHIYRQYPEPSSSSVNIGTFESLGTHGTSGTLEAVQHQLHQLQASDIWIGFQSPIGGTRTDMLDEMSTLTGTEEKSKWTIQSVGVYIKASQEYLADLNELLRHLYLERYKGHRLFVAVHHPPGERFTNRHKRSYSSTFYEGVKYMSDPAEVEQYLSRFDTVQWIDLGLWSSSNMLNRLIQLVGDTSAAQPSDDSSVTSWDARSAGTGTTVSGALGTIPCLSIPSLNVSQRQRALLHVN